MTCRTASESITTSCPRTLAVPADGLRNVDRIRNVVVLPAPLDPIKPNKSPLFTVISSPCSAARLPYIRVKPSVSTAIIGGAGIWAIEEDADLCYWAACCLADGNAKGTRQSVFLCLRRGEKVYSGFVGADSGSHTSNTAVPEARAGERSSPGGAMNPPWYCRGRFNCEMNDTAIAQLGRSSNLPPWLAPKALCRVEAACWNMPP